MKLIKKVSRTKNTIDYVVWTKIFVANTNLSRICNGLQWECNTRCWMVKLRRFRQYLVLLGSSARFLIDIYPQTHPERNRYFEVYKNDSCFAPRKIGNLIRQLIK